MQSQVVYTENAAGLGVQESGLIYLDSWCPGKVSVQANVYGPATYTVFSSLDDPTDPAAPVPIPYMTWFASPSIYMVNSTIPAQMYYDSAPRFIKLVQTAGAGVVQLTVIQQGVVPF